VCTGADGDVTRLAALSSCGAPGPLARRASCCPPSDEPFITRWLFEGRFLGTSLVVDEADEGCVATPDDPYPIGPFEAWAPAELCDDPLGWSGVPLFFSFRTPGADPCGGGGSHAESCTAHLEGDRIVVELEIAASERGACEAELSDDVAFCALLPVPAGTYEVVDGAGRTLGRIVVPGAPPTAREPRCTPVG
jgi:hypothetical protein